MERAVGGHMLDRQQTVAHVVLDHSECAEVFQRHRIDFCCRGDLSLEEAARARKVDVEALLAELTRTIEARQGTPPADPRALSTPQLVGLIVERYHQGLRRVLPFAQALAMKVSRVHGDHNPKLRDLEQAVIALVDTLLPHLDEEEHALFPLVTGPAPDQAEAARQLAAMTEEHLAVAALLERIREATDEFTLPSWACNSYRTLFSELEQLEADVFAHVHLENHVLKPRFAAA
jgi:regulator of cell morphogenesis and NO signaling